MAKVKNARKISFSTKSIHLKKNYSEVQDWKDATCSVCMECPHNAVLLLCSSYKKGCRPYMCATSDRYSNCLDQFKKAYTKSTPTHNLLEEKTRTTELLCPLCRGHVKGWTVVEPARKYHNTKKRTCMLENCSFVGTYRGLRKHVRAEHCSSRPREVDPSLAEKWKKLEHDSELNDVFSTIRSSMPGAVIIGDYVIERNYLGISRDYLGGDGLLRLGGGRDNSNFGRGVVVTRRTGMFRLR